MEATLLVAGMGIFVIGVLWFAVARALNGDHQAEAGGSYGRQVFGRNRTPKKPDDNEPT